jgi:hypothetical protein
MDFFKPIKCDNFTDFLTKVDKKVNKGWMFRGQQSATWPLAHRFERACDRLDVLAEKRNQIEHNMIREFRRQLHHYTTTVPPQEAVCESLAIMQHHGAPTRLLDFTYSPYIAAYFAFELAEPNSLVAIWAVDFESLAEHLKDISEDLYKDYHDYRYDRENKESLFKNIFIDNPETFVLSVNPFRLNERLTYQRGVFLCPSNVTSSLMDNLYTYLKNIKQLSKSVIKYTIPTGQKNLNTIEALEKLDSMNISATALFPTLDGFAKSLETRIKSLFEIQLHVK